MNFWQWLFGYTDEDIKTLQKINREKLSEARAPKKKTWQDITNCWINNYHDWFRIR